MKLILLQLKNLRIIKTKQAQQQLSRASQIDYMYVGIQVLHDKNACPEASMSIPGGAHPKK